jgi:hypothetical protein
LGIIRVPKKLKKFFEDIIFQENVIVEVVKTQGSSDAFYDKSAKAISKVVWDEFKKATDEHSVSIQDALTSAVMDFMEPMDIIRDINNKECIVVIENELDFRMLININKHQEYPFKFYEIETNDEFRNLGIRLLGTLPNNVDSTISAYNAIRALTSLGLKFDFIFWLTNKIKLDVITKSEAKKLEKLFKDLIKSKPKFTLIE